MSRRLHSSDEDGPSHQPTAPPRSKPQEEVEVDLDDIEDEELELGPRKRGRVKLDGYDSNESEEEEDMFGEEDQKKKKVKFMEKDEIEGQEWDKKRHLYTEDGIKIEAFNMDDELDEGKFDESGMYIRTKDEFAHHDNWLQGTNAQDIEKAKAAHDRQEARAKVDNQRDQAVKLKPNDLWKTLLALLKPGENVFGALKRLRGTKEPAWKKKKTIAVTQANPLDKQTIDALTAVADKMMAIGNLDVYSDTYEQIIRRLRIEEAIDETFVPGGIPEAVLKSIPELAHLGSTAQVSKQWEYKWSNDQSDVFGPYSTEEIKAWQEQGFFNDDVVVRQVTSSSTLDPTKDFVKLNSITL